MISAHVCVFNVWFWISPIQRRARFCMLALSSFVLAVVAVSARADALNRSMEGREELHQELNRLQLRFHLLVTDSLLLSHQTKAPSKSRLFLLLLSQVQNKNLKSSPEFQPGAVNVTTSEESSALSVPPT